MHLSGLEIVQGPPRSREIAQGAPIERPREVGPGATRDLPLPLPLALAEALTPTQALSLSLSLSLTLILTLTVTRALTRSDARLGRPTWLCGGGAGWAGGVHTVRDRIG